MSTKIEEESRACLKAAKRHLKKNSAGWTGYNALMRGRTKRNGIAEAYGLFRSLVSNILTSTPEPYFDAKREEQREITSFLGAAVYSDFKIGKLRNKLERALWQNFPYGFGAIAEQVETVFIRDEKGERIGIDKQRFSWKNIPCQDVLFDPDGFDIDLSDHRYIFLAYYRTVLELREAKEEDGSPTYKNLGEKGGRPSIEKLPTANEATRSGNSDTMGGMVTSVDTTKVVDDNPAYHQLRIWRMYDRVYEKVYDLLDADQRCVREADWPMKVRVQGLLHFPVTLLAMNTETDDFYPTPEMELIAPQMVNLGKMNDVLMTDLTTKIRKYIGLSPYLDEDKMGKITDSKRPNNFILTSNVDVLAQAANAPKIDQAANAIHKLEDIEPSPSLFPGMSEVREQVQNITAYGMASRGGLPQIRSAKEAVRVSDAVMKSMMGRQSKFEEATADIAIYHALLIKAAVPDDSERYVRVTDKLTALSTWRKYKPGDIPDEEDMFWDVYVGSSTPQTLDSKKAQFLQQFQIMAPILREEKLSLLPLLYQWAEVFSIRGMDQLLKNPKGAAMEMLAAIVKSAHAPDEASPDMLLKAGMNVIDAILSGAEKSAVIQAMQPNQEGAPAPGGGGMAELPRKPRGDTVEQAGGNV